MEIFFLKKGGQNEWVIGGIRSVFEQEKEKTVMSDELTSYRSNGVERDAGIYGWSLKCAGVKTMAQLIKTAANH